MTERRNIAIIAHVDHGKTTLVDALLRQSGTFRANQQVAERLMDSNDLEKERGITILAKCTTIYYDDVKLNIVDTPGHADFGGEVERVLSMVDGVVMLVDSSEGPMPQTKFVLTKALAKGLKPIVVINKVDRSDARISEVLDEIFDLFVALDANDEQLDFPVLYAVGRDGWAVNDLEKDEHKNLDPLFKKIIAHVPAPNVDKTAPFSFLSTLLDVDPYLGRILIGKIYSGVIKTNSPAKVLNLKNETVENGRISKIMGFHGVDRIAMDEAEAGDIVCIAGLVTGSVADTVCDPQVNEAIQTTPVDPPTMAVTISVNDSPLAGTEGSKVTSRMIRDRLFAEGEKNVAIRVSETGGKDAFEVGGRGELQLGVLIENMRREGFEVSVSRPRVLFEKDENGKLLEPYEEVQADVDEPYTGIVVEKMSKRKGEMTEMKPSGGGKMRLKFIMPSRGLIGYQSEFLTDTRGTGIMSRLFHSYGPHKGDIEGRTKGVLISMETGETTSYCLAALEERGDLFVGNTTKVYPGMIIGEHSRDNDLEVNPIRAKALTNFRVSGKEDQIRLTPPRAITLEYAISYIGNDELMEVTPKSIRLRKKELDPNERKKAERSKDRVAS